MRDVTLHYETYNRPPEIRAFRLDGDGAVAREATFRWEVRDPDGDAVGVILEYRPVGGSEWSRATWDAQLQTSDDRPGWRDERRTWSTASLAEGRYEIRAFATDAAANPPDAGLSAPALAPRTLIVDRSPPRLEWQETPGGEMRVTVQDEHSEIRRVELVTDGEVRATLRAEDGVSDSGTEAFVARVPSDRESIVLRAVDAAGNRAETPLTERR
jgi:hypothetical protein